MGVSTHRFGLEEAEHSERDTSTRVRFAVRRKVHGVVALRVDWQGPELAPDVDALRLEVAGDVVKYGPFAVLDESLGDEFEDAQLSRRGFLQEGLSVERLACQVDAHHATSFHVSAASL
jgi:hypothetical protein